MWVALCYEGDSSLLTKCITYCEVCNSFAIEYAIKFHSLKVFIRCLHITLQPVTPDESMSNVRHINVALIKCFKRWPHLSNFTIKTNKIIFIVVAIV